jgi:sialate O-acetylesterase
VKPNALFSDGAVLQRGMNLPVWGTANEGEKVTVTFGKQVVTTTAKDGKWMVRLEPLKASGPSEMTISGENTVRVKNLLVGEVWVCSGQSNMEFTVSGLTNAEEVKAASNDPELRLLNVPPGTAPKPIPEIAAEWKECGPQTVASFSAVGYFFGRDLRKKLKVPVGLINSSRGGSVVQEWINRDVMGDKYELVVGPTYGWGNMGMLRNAMIAPLMPYGIKGVIWYQGEYNASWAYQYRTVFPMLIENWRDEWGEGNFPFLFAQLAPYMPIVSEPQESAWAELREAQLLTSQTVPRTAMVVITDCGDPADIHPKKKEPVGARLALAAEAVAYHQNVIYNGPVYRSMKISGNSVILSFNSVDGGLVAKDGDLKGFAVAGTDRKFYNAEARIQGRQVLVKSAQVPNPIAVRFGWADCPVANLYNKAGLPASPFRTDDFPMVTKPK